MAPSKIGYQLRKPGDHLPSKTPPIPQDGTLPDVPSAHFGSETKLRGLVEGRGILISSTSLPRPQIKGRFHNIKLRLAALIPEKPKNARTRLATVLKHYINNPALAEKVAQKAHLDPEEVRTFLFGDSLPESSKDIIKIVKALQLGPHRQGRLERLALDLHAWACVEKMRELPKELPEEKTVVVLWLRWASVRWREGKIRGWGRESGEIKSEPARTSYNTIETMGDFGEEEDGRKSKHKTRAEDAFYLREDMIRSLLSGHLECLDRLPVDSKALAFGALGDMIIGPRMAETRWASARMQELQRVVGVSLPVRVLVAEIPVQEVYPRELPPSGTTHASLIQFLALPEAIRDLTIEIWRAYLRESARRKENSLEFLSAVTPYLAERSREGVDAEIFSQGLAASQAFLSICDQILFTDTGALRPSVIGRECLKRLRDFYEVPIEEGVAAKLLDGLDRLGHLLQQRECRFEEGPAGAKSRSSLAMTIFPDEPQWMRDLLVHFYLRMESGPHHQKFVLRAVRLLRGISNEDMLQRGFTRNDFSSVESGDKTSRENFAGLSQRYHLKREAHARCYFDTHYGDAGYDRLTHFKKPFYVDHRHDLEVLGGFKPDRPTIGEKFCLARLELGLSQMDMMTALVMSDLRSYQAIESNVQHPSFDVCRNFCDLTGESWNNLVLLLLQTHDPQILKRFPFLLTRPVYIHPSTGEDDELRLTVYASRPNTFGQTQFEDRRRLGISLRKLNELSGVPEDRLKAFELGDKPTPEEKMAVQEVLAGLLSRVKYDPRTNREVPPSCLGLRRIKHLESIFEGTVPQEAYVIPEAMDRFHEFVRQKRYNLNNARSRILAAQFALPGQARWLQALVAHLYQDRFKPLDHFHSNLKALRLLMGISSQEAASIEMGGSLKRAYFGGTVAAYRMLYEKAVSSYTNTVFPKLPLSKLRYYRKPVIFDVAEAAKIKKFCRNSPTLGEMLFFYRVERDWTQRQMADLLDMDQRDYEKLENNDVCPALETAKNISEKLEVDQNEVLSLLLATFHKKLGHPRLQTEPIYVNYNDTGDVHKLEKYEKAPGSVAEEIFFQRKKAGMSFEVLAVRMNRSRPTLRKLESGQRLPTEEEMQKLEEVFPGHKGAFRSARPVLLAA